MALDNTSEQQIPMHFQTSQHQMVGMEGTAVEAMRDNAPRVVGGLRLASILMAAGAHPLLGAHAFFVLASEAVLLAFANRGNIEKHKMEKEEEGDAGPIEKAVKPHKYPLESSAALDVIGEIPHFLLGAIIFFDLDVPVLEDFMSSFLGEEAPAVAEGLGGHPANHFTSDGVHIPHDKLPAQALESTVDSAPSQSTTPERPNFAERPQTFQESLEAARAAAEASAPDAAALAATETSAEPSSEKASHWHLTSGAMMLHGALGVLAHLPLWLFGPEKAGHHAGHLDLVGDEVSSEHVQESLEFSKSESKIVGTEDKGLMQWFRDNQVAISSVLQVAMGVTMMVALGAPDIYRLAGVPLIAAGALQAAFVTKRDFSADAPADEAAEKQVSSTSHHGTLIREYEKLTGVKIL